MRRTLAALLLAAVAAAQDDARPVLVLGRTQLLADAGAFDAFRAAHAGSGRRALRVAGVCALVLSVDPELTPWRVKAILEETADDLPPRGSSMRSPPSAPPGRSAAATPLG